MEGEEKGEGGRRRKGQYMMGILCYMEIERRVEVSNEKLGRGEGGRTGGGCAK